MILARKGVRPFRLSLGLMAATLVLLAAPCALAGLTVTLTDSPADDVRVSQPYLGPQATVGGYVEWVVRVASDEASGQRIAIKNTLSPCMELLAHKDPTADGTVRDLELDPRAGQFREVQIIPAQPDAVVSVEGNTLLVQNVSVPAGGELRVSYWARVAGRPRVLPEGVGAVANPRDGQLVSRRGTLTGGTQLQRTTGLSVTGESVDVGQTLGPDSLVEAPRTRSLRTRPIECSACCNQVKVVDEEARLHLSQTPYTEVGFCAAGATGFEVLIPGATIPAYR